MGTGRKYLINKTTYMPYGVCTSANTTQYNLTNDFYLNCEGVDLYYNNINLTELSSLSNNDYDKRLNDFLLYVGVLPNNLNTLKINAIFETPDCINCLINSNFTVQKYDTGVQVINYGVGYNVLQFAIVNVGSTLVDGDWQDTDIFLNMDMNLTYDVYVRDFDYINERVLCMKMNRIDFSQFNPIVTKTVSINNVNSTTNNKNGFITITPVLENQEMVTLDIETGINVYGDANASINLYCKPNNGAVYNNILSNLNGIDNCNFNIRVGDEVCYDLQLNTPTYGDSGDTYICLTNATGSENLDIECGTTCVDLMNIRDNYNVVLSLEQTSDSHTDTTCQVSGILTFDPINGIPQNECISVTMGFDENIIGSGVTTGIVYCRPNGDTNYHIIANKSQLQTKTFELCNGDDICYDISAEVTSANSDITSSILLSNVSPISLGVNPSIGTIDNDNAQITSGLYTVSLQIPTTNNSLGGCGIINETPTMFVNDSYDIDINLHVYASKRLPDPEPEDEGESSGDPGLHGIPPGGIGDGSDVPGGVASSQMKIYCNESIVLSVAANADLGDCYAQDCSITHTLNVKNNDNVCITYALMNTVQDVTGDGIRDGNAYFEGSISYSSNHDNYNIDQNNYYFSCTAGNTI